MRHNKKNNHLGRTSSHRSAMLANMCISLIQEKRIFTTVAKAKALRKVVEPIITKSKEDTTHSRRLVFQDLKSGKAAKAAVQVLFQDVAQKVADRPGGYTRIIKTGHRLGDNASMCFIELVDYNDDRQATGKVEAKSTRRSRRGGGSKATEAAATAKAAAPKAEAKPKAKAEEKIAETKPTAKEAKVETKTTAPKAKAEAKPKVKAEEKEVETTKPAAKNDETKKDEEK